MLSQGSERLWWSRMRSNGGAGGDGWWDDVPRGCSVPRLCLPAAGSAALVAPAPQQLRLYFSLVFLKKRWRILDQSERKIRMASAGTKI